LQPLYQKPVAPQSTLGAYSRSVNCAWARQT
jgi:hypothetical protein